MSNYKVNEQDKKRVEHIRRQYLSHEDNKMEQLQKLDSKVKTPGKVVASLFGVIGALVMGSGMSLVMVWENMAMGLAFGIPGLIVVLLAYPAYVLITNGQKKKYVAEIMGLSDDLMQE